VPSRTHLQRSIPLYHDSFQNALDNLSEQIVSKSTISNRLTSLFRLFFCFCFPFSDAVQFIAKAFLERDYEALKASAAPQPIEDAAMSDVNQVEPVIQPPPTEKVEMNTELEPMPKSEEALSANQSAPAEIKPDTQSGDDVIVKKESDNNAAPDQSPPGPNEDLTFDSVLNDTGGTNDFGLSLDFNDDDMGNQAFLSGSNFTTSGTTGGVDRLNATQPPGNTSDAPAGGGAFDMELQKTEGDDSNFLQGNSGEDFMGPAESNFDDLFMDTDNFGENGGDFNQLEGDSLMNVNELDDNWFN
jgi:hypothetical protein